jgi:hypothetical protein
VDVRREHLVRDRVVHLSLGILRGSAAMLAVA